MNKEDPKGAFAGASGYHGKGRAMTSGMMSSATDDWPTPRDFFAKVNARFDLELDVCASAENAKCARYFTKDDDGLVQSWTGRVWMNPPYGREIGKWIRKAYESAEAGALVVCLVPARTDTAWWHDYVAKGRVEFIRGRLRFGSAKENAPFPSALVVFGHDNHAVTRQNCRVSDAGTQKPTGGEGGDA